MSATGDMHDDGESGRESQIEQERKLEADRFKAAVEWVMGDKRGRLLLYRLLESAGVYRISYTGNADTNFREGGRNEGLKLLAWIEEYCPGSYMKMLKEQRLKGNTDG